ncbi:MAG: alpha/beta hydrolase [Burkholderiales bacterium]
MTLSIHTPVESTLLPAGIRSRFVDTSNGLSMHLLEGGHEDTSRPCVLLLHGFPELAYSWRKVMPALVAAGYHVVAPDQRGYGRTTGGDARYDGDWGACRMLNLVLDVVSLLDALGRRTVRAVVGHDFGSPVAAWCALSRPDVFRSVVLMSAPFSGPPPPAAPSRPADEPPEPDIHVQLAALAQPRKHYQWYYSTRDANDDMWRCAQGVHAFLRAYYHVKSADRALNQPVPLRSWSAGELAKLPEYYVMDLHRDMAATVALEMPTITEVAACRWLSETELGFYSGEYARTGFQGGLQWYRCATAPQYIAELQRFAGRTIDVPAMFIAGKSDWGVYQKPGDFERMQSSACTRMLSCHLIDGAGHWVQQEQPDAVNDALLAFLGALG